MKKILFAILFFSACCPKYTPSTTEKIDTIYKDTIIEVFVPIPQDTFTVNFDQICDSINKGLHPVIHIEKRSTGINSKHKEMVILDTGRNIVICETDSLESEILKRDLIIHDLKTVTVIKEPYNWWKPIAIAFMGATLVLGLIVRSKM